MDLEKARERVRAAYRKIENEKNAKKIRLIPLENVSKLVKGGGSRPALSTAKNPTCQALCLTGKKCTFRATSPCGKFCKKHIIEDGQSCGFINVGVPCAQPACT